MKTLTEYGRCRPHSRRNGVRGFSLIELLVGMVLGLLAIISIFQILSTWDARRRTITAGGSAQISGEIGLIELERDLQQSGFGLANAQKALGCSVIAYNSGLATQNFTFRFAPVEIVDGLNNGPDTINVLSGNSAFVANIQTLQASTATTKTLQYRTGFNAGDLVVVTNESSTAIPPIDCSLFEITGNETTDTVSIKHETGSYTSFYTGSAVVATMNATGAGVTYTKGSIYNLGPAPQRNQWQVTAAGVLTRTNSLREETASEVSEGVINLQAQYGIDGSDGSAPNKHIEDAEWTNTQPTTNWSDVLAIRVAVLARSSQLEKEAVTPNAPKWAANTISFVMHNLDGSSGATTDIANDWHHYRYRVYETMVPLRNMNWGKNS
jgi:type IV pilus assembly protein PilW